MAARVRQSVWLTITKRPRRRASTAAGSTLSRCRRLYSGLSVSSFNPCGHSRGLPRCPRLHCCRYSLQHQGGCLRPWAGADGSSPGAPTPDALVRGLVVGMLRHALLVKGDHLHRGNASVPWAPWLALSHAQCGRTTEAGCWCSLCATAAATSLGCQVSFLPSRRRRSSRICTLSSGICVHHAAVEHLHGPSAAGPWPGGGACAPGALPPRPAARCASACPCPRRRLQQRAGAVLPGLGAAGADPPAAHRTAQEHILRRPAPVVRQSSCTAGPPRLAVSRLATDGEKNMVWGNILSVCCSLPDAAAWTGACLVVGVRGHVQRDRRWRQAPLKRCRRQQDQPEAQVGAQQQDRPPSRSHCEVLLEQAEQQHAQQRRFGSAPANDPGAPVRKELGSRQQCHPCSLPSAGHPSSAHRGATKQRVAPQQDVLASATELTTVACKQAQLCLGSLPVCPAASVHLRSSSSLRVGGLLSSGGCCCCCCSAGWACHSLYRPYPARPAAETPASAQSACRICRCRCLAACAATAQSAQPAYRTQLCMAPGRDAQRGGPFCASRQAP